MQDQLNKYSTESDRRQLTIVHCDIVNSTQLTEDLDIEEIDTVKFSFEQYCRSIVEKNQGVIGMYTGDGIESYFGFPHASEDSTKNALTCALELRENISDINTYSKNELQIRVGVATGEALVTTVIETKRASSYRASGQVTNIAARLTHRDIGNANQIIVDETTRSLCEKSFKFSSIGNHALRGLSDPAELWELIEGILIGTRFEERSRDLSPYIGRESELKLISDRWENTIQGHGGLVVIEGDAGIGKSRLIYEFLKTIENNKTHMSINLQCSPQFTTSPLYPWIQDLTSQSHIKTTDSLSIKKDKLKEHILGLGFSSVFYDIFSSLIGTTDIIDNDSDLSPQKKNRILGEEIINHYEIAAKNKPILIIIEDLHWADSTTFSLVENLTNKFEHLSGLIVTSTRDRFDNLKKLQNSDLILPPRMTNTQIDQLIKKIIKNTNLNNEVINNIKSNTDGIPLFVEEIVRSLLARQNASDKSDNSNKVNIPISLNNFLTEKIDGLGEAKVIAQIASTFGRDFNADDLCIVSEIEKIKIDDGINQLIDSRIIVKHKQSNDYYFRHALIQTSAYNSLLKSRRKGLHQLIAELLIEKQKSNLNTNPELIAFHFQASGDNSRSLEYWIIAGNRSLDSGATAETAELLDNANALIDPSNNDASYLELLLKFYILMGKALNASEGARSKKAEEAFRTAEKLSAKLNKTNTQIHSLDSEFGIIFNSGDVVRSMKPAVKMIDVGKIKNNKIGTICGYQSVGMVCFTMGKYTEAKEYLDNALEDSEFNLVGINSYPSLAYTYLAYTLYMLGEKNDALSLCEKSIESARLESSYSLCVSLGNSCYLYRFANDPKSIDKNSRELVNTSEAIGQLMWYRRGLFFQNWISAIRTNNVELLDNMINIVGELLDAKEEIDITVYLGTIAESQINFKQYDEAKDTLDRAIKIAEKNKEFYYLSQLYQTYGDIYKNADWDNDKSSFYYNQAEKIAISQNAIGLLNPRSSSNKP